MVSYEELRRIVFGDSNDKKDDVYYKAMEIVHSLGKMEKIDSHSFPSGKYYYDYVYEGYGLKIKNYDSSRRCDSDLVIYYNNLIVYNCNTYTHGPWEEILSELYKSKDAILDGQRKEADLLEKKDKLLKAAVLVSRDDGTIDIGNGIKVRKWDNMVGSYDQQYAGTFCEIYQNDQLVFDAYYNATYGSEGKNRHKEYIPGPWEEELMQYSDRAQNEGYYQLNDNETESIKQLRKLRGE